MESAESEFVLLEKGEGLGGLRIIGSEVSGERLAHVRDVAKDSLLTEAESITSETTDQDELGTSAAGAGASNRESEMHRLRNLAQNIEERCQDTVKKLHVTRELTAGIYLDVSPPSGDGGSDSDGSQSDVSRAGQFICDQGIRPESLLAEMRSAEVYVAEKRLQVAQEELKNVSPVLEALKAQLEAVEHQIQVELDERDVEMRKKDLEIEKLKQDIRELQEQKDQMQAERDVEKENLEIEKLKQDVRESHRSN